MKCISFNINGLRAHFHQLVEIINKYNPDIIGLQETKISDQIFPVNQINTLGYNVLYNGYKNHYGVALLTKFQSEILFYNFDNNINHNQRRLIIAKTYHNIIGKLIIINAYFPQGDNCNHPVKFLEKKDFYLNLLQYLKKNFNHNQPILIIGDMNISYTDFDIGIGENNKKRWLNTGKCSFLPEEREWMKNLLNWGMIDSFRYLYPTKKNYFSWFDYRSSGFYKNRGLRVDLILVSKYLINYCIDSGIDYHIRNMKNCSDHAPVWSIFDFKKIF